MGSLPIRKTYKLYVGGEGSVAGPAEFLHRAVMVALTGPEREFS